MLTFTYDIDHKGMPAAPVCVFQIVKECKKNNIKNNWTGTLLYVSENVVAVCCSV